MSDDSAVAVAVNPFKGRVPTIESLTRKIKRIERIIARADRLKGMVPSLREKLAIVSDPNFQTLTEQRKAETLDHKADRASALLASLPADVVSAILAKLGQVK